MIFIAIIVGGSGHQEKYLADYLVQRAFPIVSLDFILLLMKFSINVIVFIAFFFVRPFVVILLDATK